MEGAMKKAQSHSDESTSGAEKPISLAPLTEVEALRGLLAVKPVKGDQIKKASAKKRRAKKAGKGK
jgi:hypothetical protein